MSDALMFEFRHRNGVAVIACPPLEALGFVNGFSTRLGGVSSLPSGALNLGHFAGDPHDNVLENRRRFLSALDAEGFHIHTLRQTHSALARRLATATPDEPGDALIGVEGGRLAGVYTADCQPILLADPRTGAFAAVHAGWRGTLARIVQRTMERLQAEYDVRPTDVHAALGPSAGAAHYEVGDEVVAQFHDEFPDAADFFHRPAPDAKCHLDIRRANRGQLLAAGVPTAQIYVSDFCTMRQTDLFFSYRREKSSGAVGRLLSVIGKRSPPPH